MNKLQNIFETRIEVKNDPLTEEMSFFLRKFPTDRQKFLSFCFFLKILINPTICLPPTIANCKTKSLFSQHQHELSGPHFEVNGTQSIIFTWQSTLFLVVLVEVVGLFRMWRKKKTEEKKKQHTTPKFASRCVCMRVRFIDIFTTSGKICGTG